MTNLAEKLDFSGHTISCGIDVHLKSWTVSLYLGKQYLKSFVQSPPSVEGLWNFLLTNYPEAHYECAYESGFCGFWIQRAFAARSISCIAVNAADVPRTDKGTKNKNDRNDSRRIAAALQAGQLEGVYVPDPELEADRQLVRLNERYSNDLTRSKNRIKGLLRLMGIEIPQKFGKANWSGAFVKWLKAVSCGEPSIRAVLDRQLSIMEAIKVQKLDTLREMRKLMGKVRYRTISGLLCSIPGIGPVTAAVLIVEIGDISRFEKFDRLNSFVGLCPMQHSTGENDRKGSITTRQHRRLRYILVEAAWVAVRTDPALTLCYSRWTARVGSRRAIIKIARKLLSRIRHVWVGGATYVTGLVK